MMAQGSVSGITGGGDHPRTLQYPVRKPGLIGILTPHKPALFPPTEDIDNTITAFFTLMHDTAVVVRKVQDSGLIRTDGNDEMFIEFDLINVEPCIANAIRRALLSDVPSMAPETVLMGQNTSIFSDDMVGNRLGLVPFRADPRRFKFRPHGNKVDHPEYAVVFDLAVTPVKVPPVGKGAAKTAKVANVNVHTSDLKWVRHSAHRRDLTEESLRPVSDEILLATLHPAQELNLRLHVVKGIGKDHAKFSPVATATYRPLPKISLLRSVWGEEANRLKNCFTKGVFGIKQDDDTGSEIAEVADARLYSGGRKFFNDASLKTAVEVGFVENEFIFVVESIGALKAAVLVEQALQILKTRCEYHCLMIPGDSRLTGIKIEENP